VDGSPRSDEAHQEDVRWRLRLLRRNEYLLWWSDRYKWYSSTKTL